jgi:plastocyanin
VALSIVLLVVLRSGGPSASGPPSPSGTHAESDTPAAPERGDTPPGGEVPDQEITTYPEMELARGEARLDVARTLYAAADRRSPVVVEALQGETVVLRAVHGGWSLVAWTAPGGQVSLGWISVDLRDAVARGNAPERTGRVEGTVRLTGTPPAMQVPAQRQAAEFCKTRAVPLEEVIVKNGMLKDVHIGIRGAPLARRSYPPPPARVVVQQVDCMYQPRVQGALVGQEVEITNADPTLHNVHLYLGSETYSNQAQPKGGEPIIKELESAGTIQLTCDVHPWMRAFVVVTENPFFAVTNEDGAFSIEGLPAGAYALEAWHPRFGAKKLKVTIGDTPASVAILYDAADTAPPIGADPLDSRF